MKPSTFLSTLVFLVGCGPLGFFMPFREESAIIVGPRTVSVFLAIGIVLIASSIVMHFVAAYREFGPPGLKREARFTVRAMWPVAIAVAMVGAGVVQTTVIQFVLLWWSFLLTVVAYGDREMERARAD